MGELDFFDLCRQLFGDKIYIGAVPDEWFTKTQEMLDTQKVTLPMGTYLRFQDGREQLAPVYKPEEMHEWDNAVVWLLGRDKRTIPDGDVLDFQCPNCGEPLGFSFTWGIRHGSGYCTCGVGYQHYWYPSRETPADYAPRPPLLVWMIDQLPWRLLQDKLGLERPEESEDDSDE